MAQQKSKLPSNSGLSKELTAYHQSNEDRLDSLQTTLDSGVVSTIDSTSGAFTLGYGLSRSGQALSAGLTPQSAALGADVSINDAVTYFDGPSIALGTTGTWLVTATITLVAGAAATWNIKLHDGTTIIASSNQSVTAGSAYSTVTLAGVVTSPAADVKISVKSTGVTSGVIKFNISGNSKDSTITAVRIA